MSYNLLFGIHCSRGDIAKFEKLYELTCAQIFLGSPRSWKRPEPISDENREKIPDIPLFVHSNYLINPPSVKDDVRNKSAISLQKELVNAAAIGAKGVIVHCGQGGKDSTMEEAIDRWVNVLSQLSMPIPIILENTAGGATAPGRSLENFTKLWKNLKDFNVEYCIDTCHSWCGDFGLENLHSRLMDTIGRPPTVIHLNGSNDAERCGRDHHANLDLGMKQTQLSLKFVEECMSPVIFETPGSGSLNDILILKEYFNL